MKEVETKTQRALRSVQNLKSMYNYHVKMKMLIHSHLNLNLGNKIKRFESFENIMKPSHK